MKMKCINTVAAGSNLFVKPGDFFTKVKQINSQSDSICMTSFAGPSYLTIRFSVYLGVGGGGWHFYVNLYGTFIFQHKFLNRYQNLSEIPKKVMNICSRTIGYCFQEQ